MGDRLLYTLGIMFIVIPLVILWFIGMCTIIIPIIAWIIIGDDYFDWGERIMDNVLDWIDRR